MVSVQVIVPCYNYGRYLPACVATALSQPGVDVSVLIINDASTDDTKEVCELLVRGDRRVSVIHHATNQGHIRTYNEGLAAATADYVVLLSADDLLTPGALGRATELMEANPSVGMVYGHPLTFHDNVLPQPRTGKASWTVWPGQEWLGMMCRAGRNFIYCPEVVMRTSIQHRIGGYNLDLPHSGDMEMWMRAAAVSDIGRVNGVDQAYYRVHKSSMQRTVHAGLLFDLAACLAAYESVLSGSSLPNAKALLEQAHRGLAMVALRHALRSIQCDRPLSEEIDAYCSFATMLFPGITATPEWRQLQRYRSLSPNALSIALARLRMNIRQRLEWRLWRWRGVERPAGPQSLWASSKS